MPKVLAETDCSPWTTGSLYRCAVVLQCTSNSRWSLGAAPAVQPLEFPLTSQCKGCRFHRAWTTKHASYIAAPQLNLRLVHILLWWKAQHRSRPWAAKIPMPPSNTTTSHSARILRNTPTCTGFITNAKKH